MSTELSYFLHKSSEDLEIGNKGVHPGSLFGQAKEEQQGKKVKGIRKIKRISGRSETINQRGRNETMRS